MLRSSPLFVFGMFRTSPWEDQNFDAIQRQRTAFSLSSIISTLLVALVSSLN